MDHDTEKVCEKRSSVVEPAYSNKNITDDVQVFRQPSCFPECLPENKVEFDDNSIGISEDTEDSKMDVGLVEADSDANSRRNTDSIEIQEVLKDLSVTNEYVPEQPINEVSEKEDNSTINKEPTHSNKNITDDVTNTGYLYFHIEYTNECLDLDTEKVCEKRSSVVEPTYSNKNITDDVQVFRQPKCFQECLPENKVEFDDNSMGISEDIKDTKTDIGAVEADIDATSRHNTDSIDIQEGSKDLSVTNKYDVPEQPLNEVSEKEDNSTINNELDIAQSGQQKELSLNEDCAIVSKSYSDFIELESNLESLFTKSKDEPGWDKVVHDKVNELELDIDEEVISDHGQPSNEDSECAEFSPAKKDRTYLIQPKNDDTSSLSMHERELDMDKEGDYDQGQPLSEVSNSAELSPALNYLIKFENDKPGPLVTHKSELDMDEQLVSDQGQPWNEVSNYAKLSPAKMDDKNFCKDRTCSIQLKNDDAASVSKHELELDTGEEVSSDQGQWLNEAVACTKYYSAEKEEKGLGKIAASDIIELEDNLGSSCYAENEYDADDLPEKGTLSPGNSTSTSCYQEMEDTAFHKHNRNFKEVEENENSSNINTNELSMDEGAHDKEQQTLKEHSVWNVDSVFCIETKEISFINASRNTFSLEAKMERSSVTNKDRFNTEKHVHECRSEEEGIHFSTKAASLIDLRDGWLASSCSNESKLSMSVETCNVCCTEDKRTEMVVITRQDFATEVTLAIDQETGFVKKHASDEDEGSALDKGKYDSKNELFNPEMETESVMECSPGICEDSKSCDIVSYIRNESGQIVDIESLQQGSTLSGRCSNNDNNEIEVTLEYGHDFNKDQENESIEECLSDIREESPLYETRSFKTQSYSDNENDESLSDIPDHSALYEVVSLSSGRSETEFYVDKYFCNKELLSLNEDSAFFNCCSKHELKKTQDLNSNTETESLLETGNLERGRKNCECMSDVCEDTDGVLYETLSFCKIEKEDCCECFEEVDMACCCQCCECVRNSFTNMHE